ncbi:hypothetical protein CONPUDRAFT_169440, partial [Coniophora puteana RWD-64-598 SS2]
MTAPQHGFHPATIFSALHISIPHLHNYTPTTLHNTQRDDCFPGDLYPSHPMWLCQTTRTMSRPMRQPRRHVSFPGSNCSRTLPRFASSS